MSLRILSIILCFAVTSCTNYNFVKVPVSTIEPNRILTAARYSSLSGWKYDNHLSSLKTFLLSCERIYKKKPLKPGRFGVTQNDWIRVCRKAEENGTSVSRGEARLFFEQWFDLFRVNQNGKTRGLFTGYYEPQLFGSRKKSKRFRFALYMRPPDLLTADLGSFRKKWSGRTISGKIIGKKFVPYPSRKKIEEGFLIGRGLEMFWIDDKIDLFFLHIQGSGRIVLDTGEVVRVGYAGRNGQPYFAIGRELVKKGHIEKKNVSLQTIREWLKANPKKAQNLMNKNRSYVFFRENKRNSSKSLTKTPGPIGASGVHLTPERSLAIDRKFYVMGTPVWVETRYPNTKKPLHRLMIAQDTGGAITGPIRGDLFWGAGRRARQIAGTMKEPGQMYILLPKPKTNGYPGFKN